MSASYIWRSWLLAVVAGLFHACTAPAQSGVSFSYSIEKEIIADSAAVVSAHPLATQVGVEVLKKGGNAVDAAIAVQFALAVVYPQAGNLGGGGFMVYYNSASGEMTALDYREKAPAAAHERMYLDSAGNVLTVKSRYGALACGVPGSVDGMWKAHRRYGRLKWAALVEPAIELADKGFQITEREAEHLNQERDNFLRHNRRETAFVRAVPWKAGDLLVQKELANTLRRIAQNGRNGFYEGATAALIVAEMKRQGGLITRADLRRYRSVWRKPLVFSWRDLRIISMPPPSSGGLLLAQMLTMLGDTDLRAKGFHSAAAVHQIVEIERRAYADRARHMADPDFWPVPVDSLLDENYLRARMANFDPERATPSQTIKAGVFRGISEETTHLSIVDAEGNAVAVTTTLNDAYGSRVVVAGAGFILNNEMDDFSAKPGAPNLYGAIGGKANAIAPGKRPLSSMTPTIVLQRGQLSLVVGTPGGTTIPTSVLQILLNVYEFHLPLREAVHSKRFHHQWEPDFIYYEEGAFSADVRERLQAMGHTLRQRGAIGRVEAILRQPDGRLRAVADDRGDDAAGGY
ncbi:MAG: gamma-glutamyltransferase [Saprospiraceae bacterium]|nr:gamma-glutamyltransferase [Saprospiraceae bacterium]MDW8228603.1 gamma-glutamyltransferase [Saprospiraceae bacterium]